MKRREGVFFSNEENAKIEAFKKEFQERGGMSTEEMMQRLDAVPLEQFIDDLRQCIKECKI